MDIYCRICRRKELREFFPLNYQSDFYSETVLSMMQSMTGLAGALGDHLPQQICRICMGSLVAGYELRRLCIESYAYFQRTIIQSDSQKLSREETLPCDEVDGNDLESCLTLEQIKLEPFADGEETVTDLAETAKGCKENENGTEDRFYCCFPNCSVNYQFKELLIEHAASDHQLEKEANAAECNESEFYCIVCARTFRDEFGLLEHRNRQQTAMFHCSECGYQTEHRALYMEHARAHNKKEKICECGFKTTLTFTFKRHQTKCVPSKPKPPRQQKWNALEEHIAVDKTNEEIIALGFTMQGTTSMFYCCISHCTTVCVTQQQLCDHFQAVHPEAREENMSLDSDNGNLVRCPICLHGLPTKKALQIHLEDAYAPTFRCLTCRYNCTSRKSAILHASMSCAAKMHRCSCGYTTSYVSNINRHIQETGCPQEGSTLKYIRTRRSKSNNPTGGSRRKQLHKCKYCEKSFSTPENAGKHMEFELSLALAKQEAHDAGKQIEGSDRKQYTCHWCSAIVSNVSHLVQCMIKSEKIAGQDQDYKCTKCNECFKSYHLYVDHTNNQVCSVECWLACKHCGTKFPNKTALVKHVAEMHLRSDRFDQAKRFECEYCLQRFVSLFSLNRHRKNIHNAIEDVPNTPKRVKKH